MDYLQKYGNSNLAGNQTWGNASKVINDTLTNQYDPTTSPYYQAVKAESERGLTQTKADIASDAGGGGRYWTGARLGEQREATTDTKNALNTLLGQISMQERQNQINVIPQAMTMAETEQNDPLKKATAFQALGSLPRTIQQNEDTARYSDWLNSEYTYPMDIAKLAAGTQQSPLYQRNGTSTSQDMMGVLGNILGSQQGQNSIGSLLQTLFGKKAGG